MTAVLALVVAWAPVLPALAMAVRADDARSIHVTHAGSHDSVSDAATTRQTPCTQHDACHGQCCDICAQCFSAVSLIALVQTHSHPIQTSVLTQLHPRLFVASPDRPPRFLTL